MRSQLWRYLEIRGERLDGVLLGFMFDGWRRGAHGVDLIGHAAEGSLVCFVVGEEVFEIHVEARHWAAGLLLCEVGVGVAGGVSLHLCIGSRVDI